MKPLGLDSGRVDPRSWGLALNMLGTCVWSGVPILSGLDTIGQEFPFYNAHLEHARKEIQRGSNELEALAVSSMPPKLEPSQELRDRIEGGEVGASIRDYSDWILKDLPRTNMYTLSQAEKIFFYKEIERGKENAGGIAMEIFPLFVEDKLRDWASKESMKACFARGGPDSLSNAMGLAECLFSPFEVSMVKVGSLGNVLGVVSGRIGEYLLRAYSYTNLPLSE